MTTNYLSIGLTEYIPKNPSFYSFYIKLKNPHLIYVIWAPGNQKKEVLSFDQKNRIFQKFSQVKFTFLKPV